MPMFVIQDGKRALASEMIGRFVVDAVWPREMLILSKLPKKLQS